MLYRKVLFEIYEEGSTKKLRTLDGQPGIEVKNIRSSHADRDPEEVGTVYMADLKDPERGDFYIIADSSAHLDMVRFAASRTDEKVLEVLSKATVRPVETFEPKTPAYTAPTIPGDLKIDKNTWRFLNVTLHLKKYPLLLGPKGCGKSEVARRLADANGMDFFEFDMGQAFKPKKYFLGGMIIGESGKTEQVHSQFFNAFTSEKPTLIFLDEITRIPTASANFLMTILSRNQSFIYDDDSATRYEKGPNVTFVAAGNIGYSYVSTNRLDAAFEDRFIKISVDYMRSDQEVSLILQRVEGINKMDAEALVRAANALRAAEQNGTLSVSLSTRQVLDAAAYCTLGYTSADVINKVILSNYIIADELDTARTILQAL